MVPTHSTSALRRPMHLQWLVAMATAALTAHAEPTAAVSRPDPLDPKASVPALRYESSFKPDGRSALDKPLSWREANDTVARIGGWRVYAREAQHPDPAPVIKPSPPMTSTPQPVPTPAQPKPTEMPQGHGGHKTP